ncbi:hypothetical protein NW759_014371 [Fusarium solani]|nr:hypothetical protein NW759_014371 [Fusarium solani]
MEGDPESSGVESCHVCNLLEELFIEDDKVFKEFDPNDFKRTPTDCPLHKPVISWLYETFYKYAEELARRGASRLQSRGWYTISFSRAPGRLPQAAFVDYKHRPQRWYDLFLIGSNSEHDQSISCQQIFDSKWINLQVARQWLDTCLNKHQSKCQTSFNIPSCSPAFVVDTELDCLIPGKQGLQYVALSYRWGTRDSFKTSTSTIPNITTPGGLSRYNDSIPLTVRHTMHLVRELGERYLWVDSLCLISDDKQHMSEQLQLMGSVYAGAKLTIVATDGDAWDGILGIQGVSGPRELRNVFPWLNGRKIIVRDNPSLSGHASSGSEYFQRGWTYQEYFLSQRRLIFAKRQVHWSCFCATCHEDDAEAGQDVDDDNRRSKYTRIPSILSGQPSFGELELLMGEYVVRDLTHPEDALPGVTGLLTFLGHTFNGGFQCGLPETWFDAALMWNCDFWGSQPSGYVPTPYLKQRKLTGPRQSSLPGAILPSWSYISWKMNYLRLLDDEEDYQLPRLLTTATSRAKHITIPVTTWFSHDAPESLDKRRIDSFPNRDYTDAEDSKYLIQGWVKEKLDPVKHFEDGPKFTSEKSEWEAPDRHVYHHPALPNKYFWRPFSILTLDRANKDTKQHQYISCRTKRGWFHARSLGFGDFVCPSSLTELGMDTHVALANKSGIICGWLQLSSQSDAKRFPTTRTESLGDMVSDIKYESDYYSSDEVSDSNELDNKGPSNKDTDCLGDIESSSNDSESKKIVPTFKLDVEIVAICHRKRSNPGGLVTGRAAGGNEFYGVLWIEWDGGVAHRKGCGYVEKTMWDAYDLEEIDLVLG